VALTIRARLTVWYVAVLVGALAVFGAWVYVVESRIRLRDLDADLGREASAVAAGVEAEMEEETTLPEAAPEAYKDFANPGRVLSIYDGQGGAPLAGAGLPGVGVGRAGSGEASTTTVTSGGEEWRLVVVRRRAKGGEFQVALAQPLARLAAESAILRRTMLVGIPLVVALAAAGGWWIARRALAPVSLMVGQAREITQSTSGARLRVPPSADELGTLARAFNDLLERLDGALRAQRRFMADASHELRTPVSIVRTAAEVTLGRETRSEAEYREALSVVAQHARRLGRMVEDMLTLTRADAGGLHVESAELYLDELVAECVRDAGVIARERGVLLEGPAPAEARFRGDERLLRQMLMNLLENAVRHTPAGGRVLARLAVLDGVVEVAVRDEGPGVPVSERERIFERFVRVDAARSRPGGAGLGLPIARCLAEAHAGTLELAESGPSGSTFLVRLPLAPAASTSPARS
jgi:heavy metal sensor kinase